MSELIIGCFLCWGKERRFLKQAMSGNAASHFGCIRHFGTLGISLLTSLSVLPSRQILEWAVFSGILLGPGGTLSPHSLCLLHWRCHLCHLGSSCYLPTTQFLSLYLLVSIRVKVHCARCHGERKDPFPRFSKEGPLRWHWMDMTGRSEKAWHLTPVLNGKSWTSGVWKLQSMVAEGLDINWATSLSWPRNGNHQCSLFWESQGSGDWWAVKLWGLTVSITHWSTSSSSKQKEFPWLSCKNHSYAEAWVQLRLENLCSVHENRNCYHSCSILNLRNSMDCVVHGKWVSKVRLTLSDFHSTHFYRKNKWWSPISFLTHGFPHKERTREETR